MVLFRMYVFCLLAFLRLFQIGQIGNCLSRVYDEGFGNEATFELRGCWVSYLDEETYLNAQSVDAYRMQVRKMLEVLNENRINTVFLHVRAFGDAIYPSDFYPKADYIIPGQARFPFDPLAIFIELAHEQGIFVHAWVNPYRLTKNQEMSDKLESTDFFQDHRDIILEYQNQNGETCYVLDPTNGFAREYVIGGIRELIEAYEIDGVHFDDYFFVEGMQSLFSEEERYQAVNILCKEIYSLVHEKNLLFGISPEGNLMNAKNQGVDVETFFREDGYVDYLIPQLYWSEVYEKDGAKIDLFGERLYQWVREALAVNGFVRPKLYAGLGLYQITEHDDYDIGWKMRSSNLLTQYLRAKSLGYSGYVLFRYRWLLEACTGDELEYLRNPR